MPLTQTCRCLHNDCQSYETLSTDIARQLEVVEYAIYK